MASKAQREIIRLRQRAKSAKRAIEEEDKGFINALSRALLMPARAIRRAVPGGGLGPDGDAVRFSVDKKGSAEEQKRALKKGVGALAEATKERAKRVTGVPLADAVLGDIRLAKKALKDDKPARKRIPKPAKAPAKAEPVKAKAPAKAKPKAPAKAKPFTSIESLAASERRFGDVDPPPFSREASALATYSSKKKRPAKAQPKPQAKAKAASLKGAPRPELPKKSDPEYKAKLSKFRKWYTANRAKPKKKKVVLTKAAPVKTAPAKAAPKKVADPTGLKARIAQKRKTGQRIPKSWLKAERMEDLNVINENLAEVERGKRDMAKWRKGRAETLAKHAKHKARMRQMVADAKSQAAAQNKKYRDDKAKAAQVAESKSKMEAIKKRKADAQARLAKMKADREAKRKKSMRATMSALPGFRR